MRVLFLGTPDVAAAALAVLAADPQISLVGIVTQPDRPAGRGRQERPPAVKQRAIELGIMAPVLQPENLRLPEVVAALAALAPDVGVVAAYGEILRRNVLEIPPAGYLNIHPSLLPRYRGPAPVPAAILAGDATTGVSIIRLVRAMDAGPLVAQQTVALDGTERAGPFTEHMFITGARMICEILPDYLANRIALTEQDEAQATYTSMLTRQDGLIDWHQSAIQIERMVRAYDPWPGAHTLWRGQPFGIQQARIHAEQAAVPPGQVLPGKHCLIATGQGLLELLMVQPAGRRSMPASDWQRGLRNAEDWHLGR